MTEAGRPLARKTVPYQGERWSKGHIFFFAASFFSFNLLQVAPAKIDWQDRFIPGPGIAAAPGDLAIASGAPVPAHSPQAYAACVVSVGGPAV